MTPPRDFVPPRNNLISSQSWAEIGSHLPSPRAPPSPSLRKSISALFVPDVCHPHFPPESAGFVYFFIYSRGPGVGDLWLRRPGAERRRRTEINLPSRCPPVERNSARAGCVIRDVSKSYRCSRW